MATGQDLVIRMPGMDVPPQASGKVGNGAPLKNGKKHQGASHVMCLVKTVMSVDARD